MWMSISGLCCSRMAYAVRNSWELHLSLTLNINMGRSCVSFWGGFFLCFPAQTKSLCFLYGRCIFCLTCIVNLTYVECCEKHWSQRDWVNGKGREFILKVQWRCKHITAVLVSELSQLLLRRELIILEKWNLGFHLCAGCITGLSSNFGHMLSYDCLNSLNR